VLMTPTKNYHASYQATITGILHAEGRGHVMTECAIRTPQGTKVADVAWLTPETFRQVAGEAECSVCPEICIEVKSDSNTEAGLRKKRELNFEQGALEVWECRRDGSIRFYRRDPDAAWLFPEFPKTLETVG
ncbi:MAG: Uma2 family endonuclease, partial [Gammaproteobacteria bacterium]